MFDFFFKGIFVYLSMKKTFESPLKSLSWQKHHCPRPKVLIWGHYHIVSFFLSLSFSRSISVLILEERDRSDILRIRLGGGVWWEGPPSHKQLARGPSQSTHKWRSKKAGRDLQRLKQSEGQTKSSRVLMRGN